VKPDSSADQKLIDTWKCEERAPFQGWDFSHLTSRMIEEHPLWSYSSRAAVLLRQSSSVIDLGTGGGEWFLSLRASWPEKVTVTEDYPPNLKLAAERLAPLGVRVADVRLGDNDPMPFDDGEFDLVLNRQSGFNADEVARILAPGGTFLTQQVHGLWAHDLKAEFGYDSGPTETTLEQAVSRLKAAGLAIVDSREWTGRLSFSDVGAIVFYLKAVAWLVPGFSVETHAEYLSALQRRIAGGDSLNFEARKYLLEARKAELLS
jgi:SAM-dependent methyltransferase